MEYKGKIVKFSQNRVWRTYTGGKILDQMAGKEEPKDSHFPEDWIGSTTRAINPGREEISEGVTQATVSGEAVSFDKLIESDPNYFLGEKHIEAFGQNPMLLVKFLDSSVRLHFQAHPTAAFAQEHLNSKCGKAEAYYILESREEIEEPYIYLGFQNPPSREDFKEMIEKQEIDRMEKCFDKIHVQPGECFFIPGGSPHAIGEGILMVEIMEPSDLAVRFEFEKAGYTMPEEARFMKRGLDFCLDVFDYEKRSIEEITNEYRKEPKLLREYSANSQQHSLIDSSATYSFRVNRSTINESISKSEEDFYIGIVTKGECKISCGGETLELKQFEKFFCPAGVGEIKIETEGNLEILECLPPVPGTL